MQKTFTDEANYRELCEPFLTVGDADLAVSGFFAELQELRKKWRLADVYSIIRVAVADADGGIAMTTTHLGDSMFAESMTAWAFGQEQARRQEAIARLVGNPVSHKRGK